MVNGNLPDGWEWKTVNDLAANIQYGYTQSANDRPVGPKFLRITDIQDGQVNWDAVPYCECLEQEIPKYKLESGDILFARTGATTGKSFLIRDCPEAVFASYLIRLRLKPEVNVKYFNNFLQSSDYWSQITSVKKGSAQPGVNATVLATLQLPVAPLPEQERIVSRIEELFSDLDAGVASLGRVRAGLRRYKVSLLKSICGGFLVESKLGIGKSNNGDMPEDWMWATIGDVAESLDNMRVPVNKKEREKRLGKYPYYGANGQVGWIDDFIFDEPLVLVVEDETFTGREKPFSYKIMGKTWVNNHAHVLRAKENILDVAYLNYSLAYYPFTPMTTGTTGRKKLVKSVLMAAPFALPPLDEQRRIVAEVERRLSVVGEVESAVEAGLVRAARLRQSILKHAFEGKL